MLSVWSQFYDLIALCTMRGKWQREKNDSHKTSLNLNKNKVSSSMVPYYMVPYCSIYILNFERFY